MSNIRTIIKKIKGDLARQGFQVGDYTPTLRVLAKENDVSPETIRNAFLALCAEGALKALPHKGYVLTRGFFEHVNTLPIAFITDKVHDLSNAQNATWACSVALSNEAQQKNIPLISLHLGGLTPNMVKNQLSGLSLSGFIVDADQEELVKVLLESGLPMVSINSWIDTLSCNLIIQDNYYGSFKAVHFLKQKNLSRIAWISLKLSFNHVRERYAGYRDGAEFFKTYAPQEYHIIDEIEQISARLKKILSSKDRPNVIFAFGPKLAQIALAAIKEASLVLGKDIHIVGWSVEENKQNEYLQYFDQSYQPWMVTWKASDMAKAAIDLIGRLQEQPDLMYRINIPTKI